MLGTSTFKDRLKSITDHFARHPKLLFLVLLFMTGVFYISAWSDAPFLVTDSPGYMRFATDLQDFSLDRLPTRPPGYPLLLLLTSAYEQPTRLLFFTQFQSRLTHRDDGPGGADPCRIRRG